MSYLLICLRIGSFDQWQRCFDDEQLIRWALGSRSSATFRHAGDPGRLAVLFTWDDGERARLFTQSDEFHEFLDRAGVVQHVIAWVLEEPIKDRS